MTEQEARDFVAKMNEKFPYPRKCDENLSSNLDGHYCKGGAFLKYTEAPLAWRNGFPGVTMLAVGLVRLNPELGDSSRKASMFAGEVINYNDDELFGNADEVIIEALTYQSRPE